MLLIARFGFSVMLILTPLIFMPFYFTPLIFMLFHRKPFISTQLIFTLHRLTLHRLKLNPIHHRFALSGEASPAA